MKFETKEAEIRKELTEIVKRVILNYNIQAKGEIADSKLEELSSAIVNQFIYINPTEGELKKGLITVRQGGLYGGSSIKPRNILLDWKKLLIDSAESILTITGAITIPWLIPLAGLIVCNKILSLLTTQITEKYAVVIWVMWINRDTENRIKDKVVLDLVNAELLKYKRFQMSQEELDLILMDLEKMKCIEKREDKWFLREGVKVVYYG